MLDDKALGKILTHLYFKLIEYDECEDPEESDILFEEALAQLKFIRDYEDE